MSSHPVCFRSSLRYLNVDSNSSSNADRQRIRLSSLVDNVNNNNLSNYYARDESLFKKRIDKLNLKFYIETEKYLSNNNNMQKCQDKLFIILFKQISFYIQEIERLNILLKEKRDEDKITRERSEEISKRQREMSESQILINALRATIAQLEKRLSEKSQVNEKIQQENESLRRQNKFYKEKLQYDLSNKKLHIDPGISSNLVGGKSSDQNVNEINSNVSTCQNEAVASIRSSSKDSFSKKVVVTVNSTSNSNSNYNSNNNKKASIFENQTFHNTPFNSNENYFTKILNKKRNYSDYNPSQIKKIHFEINPNVGNMVKNGNNRYNAGASVENVKSNSKGVKWTTSSNSKMATTGSSKALAVQKDLKIIKLVKQQNTSTRSNNNLDEIQEKKEKEKEISSENGMTNDQLQCSSRQVSEIDLRESYLSAYLALNSEINELLEFEALVKDVKLKYFCGEDIVCVCGNYCDKPHEDSSLTKNKECLLYDADDLEGYRSSTSCVSEQQFRAGQEANIANRLGKNTNKYPMLTSITIDLISKTGTNTDTEKEKDTREKEVKNPKRGGVGLLGVTPGFGKVKRK